MTPIRAAIDTNVVVSGARSGGVPGEVMQAWRDGEIILCVSPPIVAEYRRILGKFEFSRDIADLDRAIAAGRHCEMAGETPSLRVVSDSDDDKFVECAVALSAEFIVSGDRALRKLGRHGSIKILNPSDFLAATAKRRAEN